MFVIYTTPPSYVIKYTATPPSRYNIPKLGITDLHLYMYTIFLLNGIETYLYKNQKVCNKVLVILIFVQYLIKRSHGNTSLHRAYYKILQ